MLHSQNSATKPIASPPPAPPIPCRRASPAKRGEEASGSDDDMISPTAVKKPATHEVSGLNARATPVTKRLAPKRYMGHSQPSASGFSPGLMPQSHPPGGSNCDSLPWPPCRRVVIERLRAETRGLRAHRTARSGATVCRRMAIGVAGEALPCDLQLVVRW